MTPDRSRPLGAKAPRQQHAREEIGSRRSAAAPTAHPAEPFRAERRPGRRTGGEGRERRGREGGERGAGEGSRARGSPRRTCPAAPGLPPEEKFGEDVRLLQGRPLHGARHCAALRCAARTAAAANRSRPARLLHSRGSPTLSARAALMSLPASFPCPSPRLCFAQVQKREGCGAGPRSASSASSSAAPGTRCPRSPPRLPWAELFLPGPAAVPQKPLGETPPIQPGPPALPAARRGRGAEGRRLHTCARAIDGGTERALRTEAFGSALKHAHACCTLSNFRAERNESWSTSL